MKAALQWVVLACLVQVAALGQRTVPFVGCPSDGQTGPIDAPEGTSITAKLSASEARKLAYYASGEALGVLAPRGWFCFGTYGSSGEVLFVSPKPLDSKDWFGAQFNGPAIELSRTYGQGSGRARVADFIGRLFHDYRSFAIKVKEDELFGDEAIPRGPYKADKLKRVSRTVVEYTTPGGADGLGLRTRLQKNEQPIDGVAILEDIVHGPDLLHLAVRLPQGLRSLARPIIAHAESEAKARK